MNLTMDTSLQTTGHDAHREQVDSAALTKETLHGEVDSKTEANDAAEQAHRLEREQAKKKTVKEAWNDIRHSVDNFFLNIRHRSITATPQFIVNNSSNILGAAHVGTEIIMFKSSLPNSVLVENANGPIDYVVKAIKRVFGESFSKSKTDLADLRADMKGRPISGFAHHILDMEGATESVVKSNVGKIGQNGKLITRQNLSLNNPWQTRSTLSGLVVWALSTIVPDKKESPEEVEQMAILQGTNMPKYIGERLRQAVWVPQWPEHKRQMIGLGIFVSGICSLLGAWRNNIIKEGVGKVYTFNGGYFCTAALTLISSIPLLFASDDQKGFGGFGAWMAGRIAFLPGSIAKKLKGDKASALYYTGASVAFQAENLTQAVIGGAEKHDGKIVDHDEVKRRAHEEAVAIRRARHAKSHHILHDSKIVDHPESIVSHIASVERAMPERVAAAAQQDVAASVTA